MTTQRICRLGVLMFALATQQNAGAQTEPVSAEDTLPNAAAIARAVADSIRFPWTMADVQFMGAMIGHHSQAVVMSRLAPTHGASPEIQRLAERIINAQKDEITAMQRWLRNRRQPQPAEHVAAGGHAHHGALMPGMLSDEQLKELDLARGAQFDRLFLTYMIKHHQGAVGMVNELFTTGGAAHDETVFKFASDVQIDQITEITRMQKMLFALVTGVTIR